MKPKSNCYFTSRRLVGLAATTIFVHLGIVANLSAASRTWSGGVDASWPTVGNWGGTNAAPGAVNAASNDVATFNIALVAGTLGGSGNPIIIDTNRVIGGLTFDTASVGAYQIGANAGLQLQLTALLAPTNLTQVTASVTSAQVIAAPIYLRNNAGSNNPTYTFRNNATSPAATLSLTGLQTWNSSTSRPGYVILDGSNTGANI
ncbi:MAG: hypothetical protein H7X97_12190, partial [Opitutaceae bacterium]|nr:hypothetical protein [Verrucomicrobiales bacterium]